MAILGGVLLGLFGTPLFAADPQKEILDGLRAKGDYAGAAEYLQNIRTNPGLPKAFAETIDYELAMTHIEAARQTVEAERDAHYRLAQEALKSFLADHAKHALASAAQLQLGDVLVERGRLQRGLGQQREGDARQKFMEAARDFLAQADTFWASVESAAEDELKKIVFKPGEDIRRSEARDAIHRRQIHARLARAWVQLEKGLTYEPGSQQRTAALQEAAARFDALYQQQRERLAGFYARLGRGLCSKEEGDFEKAFAVFEELFDQLPDDAGDFHLLRGKAAVQALEIALRPEVKKYKHGMDIARQWFGGENAAAAGAPAQRVGDVDLAIRFLGAEAASGYMKSLPPPSPEQAGIRSRQADWIRQQYTAVAAKAGPYQAQAKTRLLNPSLDAAPAEPPPGTSTDPGTRAKAALDRLLAAQAEQKAAERSGVGNDADSQRQRQQQIAAARNEVLEYCRQALRGSALSEEQRDTMRYYQAFVHYDASELAEAAADGEAIIQSRGDSAAARQAARIGLAAREALFHALQSEARTAALSRLRSLAEKVVQRWGSYPEADDARAVLADLALADGQLDKAEEYLRQMSDRSPRRGETELGVGQSLWNRAQRLYRISTLQHDRSSEADKLAGRAAELLADGIARTRKQSETDAAPPPGLAGAMLALAQIEMYRGRPAEAVALLGEGGAAKSGDARSLELLACIAAGELDKARTCLLAQQAALPPQDNAASARQVVQTCTGFQRLVKQYLTRYRDRRMDEVSKQTVEQLESFLASPAEGPGGENLFMFALRAEAYAGVAAGLDRGGPAVVPDAQQRYRRAIAIFLEALHRASVDKNFSPTPEVVVALRIDLARCLRRMSENAQALSQLLAVLKDHPQMVDAQLEAAHTYQAWGDERREYLEMAIQGGTRYQEVWGWGELARRVQPEPRFRDVFHEARYNLALCRFRQAQTAAQRSERARLAAAAEEDILATRRTDPDMGGPVWYDRYSELFERIQRLADKPAAGLPAEKEAANGSVEPRTEHGRNTD